MPGNPSLESKMDARVKPAHDEASRLPPYEA
jgi:hypothetical protein